MSLRSDNSLKWTPRQSMAEFGTEVERTFLTFVEDHSLTMLRYALVAVYVWFGLLTVTGTSPTAGLVADIFPSLPRGAFLVALGSWEIAVGVALLSACTVKEHEQRIEDLTEFTSGTEVAEGDSGYS